MNLSLEEKANLIINRCLSIKSTNLYEIFLELTSQEYIAIHGPEHHIVDGACVLTAFYNAGGRIDLKKSLEQLSQRGLKMPGAMCGHWGVCGATTSIGAAFAIMDETGPLSGKNWGKHMELTSKIVSEMAGIGGPRCCKRDGMIALKNAAAFLNEQYQVQIEWTDPSCQFSEKNQQCIRGKCPFYKRKKKKVAFLCVHNSCRSQIAEALGKHLASDVFESYSAGSEKKPAINQDAVGLMKKIYGIDMEKDQYSKLISEIPEPDLIISMGCNVSCPFVERGFDADWGLEDPTGKEDSEFEVIIKSIEDRILSLAKELSC